MKDVAQAATGEARNLTTTTCLPSMRQRMIDALRRPFGRTAHVVVPYIGAMGFTAAYGAATGSATPDFVTTVVAMTGVGRSIYCMGRIVKQEVTQGASLTNRALGLLPVGSAVAKAAARMLVDDWHRSKIWTSTLRGAHGSLYDEPRLTHVRLPSGAYVGFAHRRGRPIIVALSTKQEKTGSIDLEETLGRVDAAIVMRAVDRVQKDRLCQLLGVERGCTRSTLSHILAEALPEEHAETDCAEETKFYHELKYVIETYEIPAAEITVSAIRRRYGKEYLEVLVRSPATGVMTLPQEPFTAVLRRRRRSHLHDAFGVGSPRMIKVPVFLGNARATRIADLARQVLREHPEMIDESGSPLRKLIEDHMPRLLATHRDNTRTARSSDIAEIDATLDAGLDIVAGVLARTMDRVNDGKLDALRTELRFLEARHPAHGRDATQEARMVNAA